MLAHFCCYIIARKAEAPEWAYSQIAQAQDLAAEELL
jgi:hypothetical protein